MGEGEGGDFPPKNVSSESLPSKKLARQLDFTGGYAGAAVPENPVPVAVTPPRPVVGMPMPLQGTPHSVVRVG